MATATLPNAVLQLLQWRSQSSPEYSGCTAIDIENKKFLLLLICFIVFLQSIQFCSCI